MKEVVSQQDRVPFFPLMRQLQEFVQRMIEFWQGVRLGRAKECVGGSQSLTRIGRVSFWRRDWIEEGVVQCGEVVLEFR